MIAIAGFIDVETTGFSPQYDEIVEFAICLFEFRKDTGEILGIIDQYVGLRETTKPIPAAASRVHGIYNKDVRGETLDYERIEAMLHKADFLIAHNASFDRKFTSRLFKICDEKPWLCSMNGIKWKQKGYSSKGLQQLLLAHGIQAVRTPRAEDDVLNAIKLLAKLTPEGRNYFSELIEEMLG